MIDRNELLEAALESLPDGIALFGAEDEVVFWNQAAQEISGYAAIDLLAHPLPKGLDPLMIVDGLMAETTARFDRPELRRALVKMRHKFGHPIQVISRVLILRDGLGQRIGVAALFHPAEGLDALPHGENDENADKEEGREEFEERLQAEFEDFTRGGAPLGVLWIVVDQAQELRRTHGAAACHAMLDKMTHALAMGLRPADEMCRWGDNEFLVLAHERSAEMLATHARKLAGLARTADFRWWGDRVSLTVSIGAAQVAGDRAGTLAQLLGRAQQAMEESARGGGNRATIAAGQPIFATAEEAPNCSPS
jgi:diguanylate cyclase (GGDEF)-like protein/PAS domain S-box-containing protein